MGFEKWAEINYDWFIWVLIVLDSISFYYIANTKYGSFKPNTMKVVSSLIVLVLLASIKILIA